MKIRMRMHVGYVLVVLGVLHMGLALVLGWSDWAGMGREGFFNVLGENMTRNAHFWFMYLGVAMIPLGHLCQWLIKKRNAPLPAFLGIHLIWMSAVGLWFVPVSGFWFLLIIGIEVYLRGDKKTTPELLTTG